MCVNQVDSHQSAASFCESSYKCSI